MLQVCTSSQGQWNAVAPDRLEGRVAGGLYMTARLLERCKVLDGSLQRLYAS
jgi:hypothetical protein